VTGSEVNLHPEGRPWSTNIRLFCALRNSCFSWDAGHYHLLQHMHTN